MSQFTVYRNKNERSRATYPLLIDIQADLLDELKTRVVIPLTKAAALVRKPMSRLTPIVEVAGDKYLLMTPQLAAIVVSDIGSEVENIQSQRTAIVGSMDVLISGM